MNEPVANCDFARRAHSRSKASASKMRTAGLKDDRSWRRVPKIREIFWETMKTPGMEVSWGLVGQKRIGCPEIHSTNHVYRVNSLVIACTTYASFWIVHKTKVTTSKVSGIEPCGRTEKLTAPQGAIQSGFLLNNRGRARKGDSVIECYQK